MDERSSRQSLAMLDRDVSWLARGGSPRWRAAVARAHQLVLRWQERDPYWGHAEQRHTLWTAALLVYVLAGTGTASSAQGLPDAELAEALGGPPAPCRELGSEGWTSDWATVWAAAQRTDRAAVAPAVDRIGEGLRVLGHDLDAADGSGDRVVEVWRGLTTPDRSELSEGEYPDSTAAVDPGLPGALVRVRWAASAPTSASLG